MILGGDLGGRAWEELEGGVNVIKIKCICVRTGKVAQQLRALGTLAEDPSLAPRGYIVEEGGAHNCL